MKQKQIDAMQMGKRRIRRARAKEVREAERVAVDLTEIKIQMYWERFGKLFELVDAVEDRKASDRACILHEQEESVYDEYRGLMVIYNLIGGMPVLTPRRYWKPDEAERWVKKHTDKIMSLKGKLIFNYLQRNHEELRLQREFPDTMSGGTVESRIEWGVKRSKHAIERRAKDIENGDW